MTADWQTPATVESGESSQALARVGQMVVPPQPPPPPALAAPPPRSPAPASPSRSAAPATLALPTYSAVLAPPAVYPAESASMFSGATVSRALQPELGAASIAPAVSAFALQFDDGEVLHLDRVMLTGRAPSTSASDPGAHRVNVVAGTRVTFGDRWLKVMSK